MEFYAPIGFVYFPLWKMTVLVGVYFGKYGKYELYRITSESQKIQ